MTDKEQSEREVPFSDRVPQRIGEGMPVYDREGEAVGIVDVVYLGGASDEAIERALDPERAPPTPAGEIVRTAFETDEMPGEMRARLMKQGYIRVKGDDISGLRRYLGPEQIDGIFTLDVEGTIQDAVRLRVSREELRSD
jgi:hypothetical protein